METIAKIIDSEKIWADPDMQDFDVGEREYLAAAPVKVEATEWLVYNYFLNELRRNRRWLVFVAYAHLLECA